MSTRFSILQLISTFTTLVVFSLQAYAIFPYRDFNPTKTTQSLSVDYKLVDTWTYTSSGDNSPPSQLLSGDIIVSAWGVAYSKVADRIFTSAFLKWHSGYGVTGSGGIYMLEPTATSFNVTQFHDMDSNPMTRTRATSSSYGDGVSFSFIDDNHVSYLGAIDPISGEPEGLGIIGTKVERGLSPIPTDQSYAPATFAQIGKVGMGDLEISEDGGQNIINGASDLQAYIFKAEDVISNVPGTTSSILNFDLNFERGFVRTGVAGTNQWYPWTDDGNDRIKESCCHEYFRSQPILSDIEFTDRGDLTMAFIDRWGHQMGHANFSDLSNTGIVGNSQGAGDILIAGIDCDLVSYCPVTVQVTDCVDPCPDPSRFNVTAQRN